MNCAIAEPQIGIYTSRGQLDPRGGEWGSAVLLVALDRSLALGFGDRVRPKCERNASAPPPCFVFCCCCGCLSYVPLLEHKRTDCGLGTSPTSRAVVCTCTTTPALDRYATHDLAFVSPSCGACMHVHNSYTHSHSLAHSHAPYLSHGAGTHATPPRRWSRAVQRTITSQAGGKVSENASASAYARDRWQRSATGAGAKDR